MFDDDNVIKYLYNFLIYGIVFLLFFVLLWTLDDTMKFVIGVESVNYVDLFESLVQVSISSGIMLIFVCFMCYFVVRNVVENVEGEYAECIRQQIIEPYMLSKEQAFDLMKDGCELYAESADEGVFVKISNCDEGVIMQRLSDGTNFLIKTKSGGKMTDNDLKELSSGDMLSFYDVGAYEEMIDYGFSFMEVIEKEKQK